MESAQSPQDRAIEALASIKAAYRKSRSTRAHEPIEGLAGAAGWRVMTLVVQHKKRARESLELIAPGGKRLNVGKGYLPELVAMFLSAGSAVPLSLLN